MKKIVVFASGNGSNFQTIVEKLHKQACEVALLVCDKPGAYCIERAHKMNIQPSFLIQKNILVKKLRTKICTQLIPLNPDLIVLAGYMRIVGQTLLDVYEGKIINIHPALLPAFPGRDGITDALKYGVKIMGVTVHYVDSGIDTGMIIDQVCFKRTGLETREEIEQKIHDLEHELYPTVIKQLLNI
ncbi:MAG: phosphoribosylglycinamide formyltransferase [Turicibacter sanguinis]